MAGLWCLMDRHFETFQRVYDERFQAKYGYWRPIIERSAMAYLRCSDLYEGFARVRCGDCGHELRHLLPRPVLKQPWAERGVNPLSVCTKSWLSNSASAFSKNTVADV